jgi:hypothetical protein
MRYDYIKLKIRSAHLMATNELTKTEREIINRLNNGATIIALHVGFEQHSPYIEDANGSKRTTCTTLRGMVRKGLLKSEHNQIDPNTYETRWTINQ